MTVLVCDIVGSTALMERLGAEAMHELLGRFHDLARDEVSRYGGWVSSVHGDGFVALMGAPAAHEDHALRAVLAALGLRRRLAEGALAADDAAVPIRVRMGLDSGLVVLGSMGGDPGGRAGRDRRDRGRGRAAASAWPSPGRSWPARRPPGWWPAPSGSSPWDRCGWRGRPTP